MQSIIFYKENNDIKSLKSIFWEFYAQQKDLQRHIVFLCK